MRCSLMSSRLPMAAIALLMQCAVSSAAFATGSAAWTEIKASIFGDRLISDGRGVVALEAPNRPDDMRVVPIGVRAQFTDGRAVKSVSVIIDENPTPVVAVFKLGGERSNVALKSNFRVDRQSELRAIVEASDGALYMVSQLIKFAGGQSSCSAPPTGDPAEIAANMGKMELANISTDAKAASSSALARAKLDLNHPNHTGMVMDQQTLLYTPMRMISEIVISARTQPLMTIEGSIALSQNPSIEFDFPRSGATDMTVSFKDTDGGAWQRTFPLGSQS